MADLQLTASPRTLTGRKVRQLRNRNLTPVVLYGKRVPSEALQVEERSLERVLHSGGMSRLVEVAVDGSRTHNALIRNIQRHPVSHRLSHADFYAVDMSEKQQVSVVVEATGKPEGLAGGLIILQVMDHVEIEALPADIPDGGVEHPAEGFLGSVIGPSPRSICLRSASPAPRWKPKLLPPPNRK